jgi:hypothetical protein
LFDAPPDFAVRDPERGEVLIDGRDQVSARPKLF